MNKSKKITISEQIENSIWECIKEVSDPDSYDWEVTFKVKGQDVTLNNEILNKR
jgi:hypothetical protein